jgi:hypothetical protein
MSDKIYSHNANIQGVKFSWQKAVGSWQFANCILPIPKNIIYLFSRMLEKASNQRLHVFWHCQPSP